MRNKKSPRAVGGGTPGGDKIDSGNVTPGRPACKLQPPRDPVLRAIWKVGQAADLTPQEQLAYLALWRYLGSDTKPLGAALLGKLLGISTTRAADIFSSLQRKGYLNSTGKFRQQGGRTVRAERGLTSKLSLPKSSSQTGKTRRDSRRPRKTEPVGISGYASVGNPEPDLGVRHTVGVMSDDTPTAETTDDRTHVGRTIAITDLLAASGGGKPVKSGEGAK